MDAANRVQTPNGTLMILGREQTAQQGAHRFVSTVETTAARSVGWWLYLDRLAIHSSVYTAEPISLLNMRLRQ